MRAALIYMLQGNFDILWGCFFVSKIVSKIGVYFCASKRKTFPEREFFDSRES